MRLRVALAEQAGEHIFEIDVHLLHAVGGESRSRAALPDFDFDMRVVELAGAKLFAQLFARLLEASRSLSFSCGGIEQIEQSLFGVALGALGDFFETLFAHHVDRYVDEVANHGFDVAADVADFGELAGFDFEERRTGQLRESACDFRFADAGRPNHEDVLGHHVFGHFGLELLAANAVAQGNCDGTFGVSLPDYVLVEFEYDFAGSEFVQQRPFAAACTGK